MFGENTVKLCVFYFILLSPIQQDQYYNLSQIIGETSNIGGISWPHRSATTHSPDYILILALFVFNLPVSEVSGPDNPLYG